MSAPALAGNFTVDEQPGSRTGRNDAAELGAIGVASVYIIKNWTQNFEVAQSRKVEGALSWLALPCKHDGLGFRRIMALPDGPAVYGAWVLIAQVAAKCEPRGTLVDERGPLTPEEISFKTGCPEEVLARALQVCTSERVGWIVVAEWEPGGTQVALQDKTRQNNTGQDKTRVRVSDKSDAPPEELRPWLAWWNRLRAEKLVQVGVDAESPNAAVLAGWKRVEKHPEVRACMDPCGLEKAIRESALCRQGWFTLPKLFGGKNKVGELICQRLLEGAYRDTGRGGNGKPRDEAGSVFDPNATG